MRPTPLTLDPDFLHEYEQERLRWLRVRFLWFAGTLGFLWATGAVLLLLVFLTSTTRPEGVGIAVLLAAAPKSALFLVPFARVYHAQTLPAREGLLRLVFWMILGYSLIQLLAAAPVAQALNAGLRQAGGSLKLGLGVPVFLQTLLIHLFASLLIPWTPREAIRPLAPFLAVYMLLLAVALAVGDSDLSITLFALVAMVLIPAPGLAVCALRQSRFVRRFSDRAIRARYGELRHELDTARRIHDRLFPAPVTDGIFRVDYVYEPMRQIGGDFLFIGSDPVADDPSRPINVLLIDVTGHGIAAALAVNRLHGELSRVFGSEADASPGRVLAELNRYIYLTMSRDTVFATAACFRLDPASDHIAWANAGHPPALLLAADGRSTRLESTTFLLGAAHPDDFDPAEQTLPFRPGDALFAYTDGALEAQLRTGGMLGLAGLESLLHAVAANSPGEQWCAAFLEGLKTLRDGPAADDTLLVRICRTG